MGGVGGACLVAAVWLMIRKRRQGAASAHGGYPSGVTATVQTGPTLPNVKTGRARALREDAGVSSSPRNNLTPRTHQMGQMA